MINSDSINNNHTYSPSCSRYFDLAKYEFPYASQYIYHRRGDGIASSPLDELLLRIDIAVYDRYNKGHHPRGKRIRI